MAHQKVVEAYFHAFNAKVEFLDELFNANRISEALSLCCCYIEAAAKRTYPKIRGSKEVFTRAIIEHGGEECLSLLHPVQLMMSLKQHRSNRAKPIAAKLEPKLMLLSELMSPKEIVSVIGSCLSKDDREWLQSKLWLGSLAVTAYVSIRCQLVHGGGYIPISFSASTHNGQVIERLDFPLLYRVLKNVVEFAEAECIRKPDLFDARYLYAT